MVISRQATRFLICCAVCGFSAGGTALGQSPVESKTWYLAALDRLGEIDDTLLPPGERLQISDAMLASMLFDTYQEQGMADTVERLAKLDITPPASLPENSPQRGIYSFVQLGHLQVAYAKPLAVMSAQAADDLFKQAKSPVAEAAWSEQALARLWVRLGELDKALAVLDETSSLYIEQRVDLIRHAHAAAQVGLARELARSTPEAIKKASSEVDAIEARGLARLVDALADCGEIDAARDVMKRMPPEVDALKAYQALARYDQAHGDDEALEKDVEAMIDMLGRMSEFGSDQTTACIRAAEICTKLRRDADAVKCLDRLDELAAQPDPPLTMPFDWANAARIALYTTANDRADGYLARATAAMKAYKEAKEDDRLVLDIMITRVEGVRGNGAVFDRRMKELNPRFGQSTYFMVPIAVRDMMIELAGVSRDDTIVGSLKQIVARNQAGMGEVSLAMARRYCRTGDLPQAWTLASTITDRQWRLRAMIEVTDARLKIHDEGEQNQALLDLQTFDDPREAAYVMFAVGAMLNGDEGFVGDAWMRWRD